MHTSIFAVKVQVKDSHVIISQILIHMCCCLSHLTVFVLSQYSSCMDKLSPFFDFGSYNVITVICPLHCTHCKAVIFFFNGRVNSLHHALLLRIYCIYLRTDLVTCK